MTISQNLISDKAILALNKIAQLILADADPNITTRQILILLESSIKVFAATSLLVDEQEENLVLKSFTQSKVVMQALKMVPSHINITNLSYPLKSNTLIAKCITEDKIITSNNLADFFYPVFPSKRVLNTIQRLLMLKTGAAIPIKTGGKAVGAFFIVTKKKKFEQEDLDLLQFYANLSGIAMENHKNINRLQRQFEEEKETGAILTHELKTPIAIAYNSSTMIGEIIEKFKDEMGADLLAHLREQQLEIHESIIRMNRICNSIFSLTEVENNISVKTHRLNLSDSIGHLIRVYEKYKPEAIKLSYEEEIIEDNLWGPGIQVEQVISIILENAFKYTKEGEIKVKLRQTKDYIQCTISDNGCGIQKDEKEKIFNRFYRAKSKGVSKKSGLGLGLYIAKKIIDKLEGEIIVTDNENGGGTCFNIKVPLVNT